MTNQEFNIGDIVWLKSGGPAMTVKGENKNDDILCTWFANNEPKDHPFVAGQLTNKDPSL